MSVTKDAKIIWEYRADLEAQLVDLETALDYPRDGHEAMDVAERAVGEAEAFRDKMVKYLESS